MKMFVGTVLDAEIKSPTEGRGPTAVLHMRRVVGLADVNAMIEDLRKVAIALAQ
jgi:hypothetical protein